MESQCHHNGLLATVFLLLLSAMAIVFWVYPVLTATVIALGVIAVATRGLAASGKACNQTRRTTIRKNT